MAFAYTVTKNGVQGDWKVISGTWTGSANDSAGSVPTGGTNVLEAVFETNLTSGPTEKVVVSGLAAAGSGTVTVYNHQTVTAGSFKVVYR